MFWMTIHFIGNIKDVSCRIMLQPNIEQTHIRYFQPDETECIVPLNAIAMLKFRPLTREEMTEFVAKGEL